MESTDTRTCPFCAEEIKAAAIVCKHCGRDVPAPDATEAAEPPADDADHRGEAEEAARKAAAGEKAGRQGCLAIIVLGVLLSLAIGYCGDSGNDSSDRGGDATARSACERFAGTLADIDIITDAELLDRLRAVNDRASASSVPGIAANARTMLSAAIDNDEVRLLEAAGAFSSACQRIR